MVKDSIYCEILGLISVYFFFIGLNYAVALAIEIEIKIKYPLDGNYKKRAWFYHISSHLTSFIITVVIASYWDSGESAVNMCMIDKNSYMK